MQNRYASDGTLSLDVLAGIAEETQNTIYIIACVSILSRICCRALSASRNSNERRIGFSGRKSLASAHNFGETAAVTDWLLMGRDIFAQG